MDQQRLFRLAVVSLSFNAYYDPPEGWHLIVRSRRDDELWQDTEPMTYSCLSSSELADVVACEVQARLGLI